MTLTVAELKALPIGTPVALPDGADAYPDFLIAERLTSTGCRDCRRLRVDRHRRPSAGTG